MMSFADLPTSFWGYALTTATFTLNRTPSRSVDKAPHEIWFGKPPSLSFLKVWGCEDYVKRLLSDKAHIQIKLKLFIGYPKETRVIISIIPLRTKCLLLGIVSFWKKISFPRSQVGEMFSLMRFKLSNKPYSKKT